MGYEGSGFGFGLVRDAVGSRVKPRSSAKARSPLKALRLSVHMVHAMSSPADVSTQGEDSFGNSIEKCDESWSMDNIKVRVISYD